MPNSNRTLTLGILAFAATFCSPTGSLAASIYLCKTYSGQLFWSSAHCHQSDGLILRTVTVPDGMPFEQQVELGRQAEAEGKRLREVPKATVKQPSSSSSKRSTCASLTKRARQLDSYARSGLSAREQERVRQERKSVREQEYRLGCHQN